MATSRKSKPQSKARPTRASHAKSAKPKASAAGKKAKARPAAKPAAAKKPVTAAKPAAKLVVAKPAHRPPSRFMGKSRPRPAAPVVAAKPALKGAIPGKPGAKGAFGKGAPAAVGKGAKGAAKGAAKGGGKRPVRSPANEVVRPIGVLPLESRQRVPERHTSTASVAHRPFPVKPPAPRAASQAAERVTESELKEFEQRLLAERAKILKEMGHLENTVLKQNQRDSSGDLSGYSFHMADASTDAMEREKAFLFASAEGRHLLEINEALRRIYQGTYGICEISGLPIARARLLAIPWARYTIEVQEQLEKDERSKRGNP